MAGDEQGAAASAHRRHQTTISVPPAEAWPRGLQAEAIECMLPVSRGCGTETLAPVSS